MPEARDRCERRLCDLVSGAQIYIGTIAKDWITAYFALRKE